MRNSVWICLLLLGCAAGLTVHAEDLRTTKTVCKAASTSEPQLEDCIKDIFTLQPISPSFGSIAPGSSFAGGAKYSHSLNSGRFQSMFSASGLYSLKDFYLIQANYQAQMPAPGKWQIIGRQKYAADPHHPKLKDDDQTVLRVYASRIYLRVQDFYGIGGNTTLAGHAVYTQRQDATGIFLSVPFSSWFSVSTTLQRLAPTIRGVAGNSLPSVPQKYGEAGAPGITAQPSFFDFQATAGVRKPSLSQTADWEDHHMQVLFDHFADLGSGLNSFNRLEGWGQESFLLRHDIPFQGHRSWVKNVLCQAEVGKRCLFGTLQLNQRVTASYVTAPRAVPFYFQPTLGGTDINGIDTLRGLVDYRFRAPNRVLLQAELDHHVWGPLGLYVFYDTGKVASQPSDLALTSLRHDVGVGMTISVMDKVVLRGYIGFGAGEGSHPNFKLPVSY